MSREKATSAIDDFCAVIFPGRMEIWICRGRQWLDLHWLKGTWFPTIVFITCFVEPGFVLCLKTIVNASPMAVDMSKQFINKDKFVVLWFYQSKSQRHFKPFFSNLVTVINRWCFSFTRLGVEPAKVTLISLLFGFFKICECNYNRQNKTNLFRSLPLVKPWFPEPAFLEMNLVLKPEFKFFGGVVSPIPYTFI